jgi:tetratricopeptide (TPR) repeat protein
MNKLMIALDSVLADWRMPELPLELGRTASYKPHLETFSRLIRQRLFDEAEDTNQIQIAALDWLYRLVRSNIKRGRVFELDEVLSTRHADCLGYAKLFSALGPVFGLELGIVEVLIDNAGRYVPHHMNLFSLHNGTRRFIDAWYGSTDINHPRMGALVNGRPRDVNSEELDRIGDLKGLPEHCIEVVTLYIRGNRYLERDELDKAIKCYSEAIKLYPSNSRAFYNRALARERKGEMGKAELDYAEALKDESSLIRVLATTDALESLIMLDGKGISEEEQEIYLWHEGFKTGRRTEYEEIGKKYGISSGKVKKIITKVEGLCTG